ncbi:hypothetical protein LTR91_000981 [Friedmanniomyces endolithicus]|uniref:Uncharacterized protein n=1 Tax=Friedmanniomyces endolithicus TaxID=329885 RepID=A0AAN6L463_9PEZI|nr:hypothetical protein LTR35_013651 [Friedmanniomyces endolithicus]KAK0920120.1 hypothetical protein LTR57_009984 [Friedmanniomyces endolithicus]KAK0996362.1 hypothetical protein LTR54_010091 [Friedmanniomyces endolithicus]KAK1014118.1 hypothetical protein LTR91_000981 [Friedmanniomyces endolithicus]
MAGKERKEDKQDEQTYLELHLDVGSWLPGQQMPYLRESSISPASSTTAHLAHCHYPTSSLTHAAHFPGDPPMARASWFVGVKRKVDKGHKKRIASTFIDPNEERDPPPPATPVTFPAYEFNAIPEDGRGVPAVTAGLQSLFAKVTKPTDLTDRHVQVLGIDSCRPCTLDELLPQVDGVSHLPSPVSGEIITATAGEDGTLSENFGIASRRQTILNEVLEELQLDNDTAYRILGRKSKCGAQFRRFVHMHRFFDGLESMSRYWDSSADDYFEISAELCSGNGVKRLRRDQEADSSILDSPPTTTAEIKSADKSPLLPTPAPSPERNSPPPANKQAPAEAESGTQSTDAASAVAPDLLPSTRSETVRPQPHSQHQYRGRRLHTGREMPDQYRIDTVRAFIEASTMPFHCPVALPRVRPFAQIGTLTIPVGQTAAIYRYPRDRSRAREGRLEGPMVAIQVCGETEFEDVVGEPLAAQGRLHHMRELGMLLQIAQERRRSGVEINAGEGKWWTDGRRWGAGPGHEPGNGNRSPTGEKSNAKAIRDAHAKQVKAALYERWKDVKCGHGTWDPKTDYAAIGKDPSSPYDEVSVHLTASTDRIPADSIFPQVFMISSLNHHISIVKFTVHEAYIDHLVSGAPLFDSILGSSDPARPRMQRSQWFDLFDEQQRVEAFRGVWGVVAYLTRDTEASVGTCGEPPTDANGL